MAKSHTQASNGRGIYLSVLTADIIAVRVWLNWEQLLTRQVLSFHDLHTARMRCK